MLLISCLILFNSSRFQVINSPLIRLDVATMERHYQTVESVIYLECYIDQKSVGGGGGGGDKIARQGSDMSLARETKAILFS